ncbi:ATP-binding protein [Brevibacillus daliensis]|uniref:ATP-binding protein n=1 Tax=Brevibacillus daliensis TaxID=2892995 RepID=UPI001E3125D3|nr:ATP-binding protein [Brevibacillus daliensis]
MSPFRNMGFQMKMMLSYFVMMLLIGSVAILNSYQITKVTSEETYLMEHIIPQTNALLGMKNQLYTKMYALKMYVPTRDADYLEKYYTEFELRDSFRNIERNERNKDFFAIYDLIAELDHIFLNKINPLLKAENFEAVTYVLRTEVEPKLIHLERIVSLSLRTIEKNTSDEVTKSTQKMKISLIITYTISVASILFGLFCTLYFRRELMRPIRSLLTQVREVSKGTFGQQITYSSKDEFYELAQECNKMSRNISLLFKQGEKQNQILAQEKHVREQILDSLPVGVITRHAITGELYINRKAQDLVLLDEASLPTTIKGQGWEWLQTEYPEETYWFENKKMELLHKDGNSFLALVSYVPLLDNQKGNIGWMIVLTDITEQEQVEIYMHQSEKLAMVGQLAAGAAHEIRNPLTVIFGFMQLLQQKLTKEERNEFHLPLVIQEIERVNKIVTEMLLLSKPSKPIYKETSALELLQSIFTLSKGEAMLRRVEISYSCSPDLKLYVDQEQMKQILLNLLKNSMEAMTEGGNVTIYCEENETSITIKVTDTGDGIPIEYLSKVMDPFFSQKEGGTGLGLPITMRLVRNHGGEMEIESEMGKGTTIIIHLPSQPFDTP